MRLNRWFLSVPFLFLGCGLLVAGCGDDDDVCQCPADSVINCGHRGTGKNEVGNPYPENTLPSFQQAVAEGAQMVELDVQYSFDGELMVIHDDTVNRTTDATGCVGDLTVAELQGMDAGFGTSLEGTGVVIPTLSEVLADIDVPVNIEIKVADDDDCPAADTDLFAQAVVDAMVADTADRELVVSSFDLDVLLALHALDDTIYIGYLSLLYSDAQTAADSGFAALNVFGATYGADEIQQILDTGVEANVWTINQPDVMATLLDTGISMLITDDPDVFEQAREDYCANYCVVD